MIEAPITKRVFIITLVFSLFICLSIFLNSIHDRRTKIIFCNVGQGDATYIRINNEIDILIDAGPDKSILSCLGKYMPFWDRKIEVAFLSHPNTDHYNGYFFITDRYKIDRFITVNTAIMSKSYKKLLKILSNKRIPALFKTSGDKILVNNGQFKLYWPPKDFNSSNDNDFSSVILFELSGTRLLFTGDASPFVMSRLSNSSINKIDILKIPHHGSKNGLNKKFLDLADPKVAVISVGKNNSYGHPSDIVLDMLKAKNINIRRTDLEGDVIFNLKE